MNIWLLEDDEGWTLIDAGVADRRTRERWRALLSGPLADRPVSRLLATHFHPDHLGLAGWLCAETGAELWASQTEWLTGRLLAQDTSGHLQRASDVVKAVIEETPPAHDYFLALARLQ